MFNLVTREHFHPSSMENMTIVSCHFKQREKYTFTFTFFLYC